MKRKPTLPLRADVVSCTYHRQPTKAEINRGYGAIHYRDFPVEVCTNPDGTLRVWFVADDGLRYYR